MYKLEVNVSFNMNPIEQVSKVIELLEENPETRAILNDGNMSPNEFMQLLQYLFDHKALDFTTFMAMNSTYMEIVNKRISIEEKLERLAELKDDIDPMMYKKIIKEILCGE